MAIFWYSLHFDSSYNLFITSLTTPKILAVDLLMLFLSGIIFVSFMRIMYVSMHLFEARYAVETLDSFI